MDLSSSSLIFSSVVSSILMNPVKLEAMKCLKVYPMCNLANCLPLLNVDILTEEHKMSRSEK